MAKIGKRLLSLLLSAAMVITLFPPADTAEAATSIIITKPLASATSQNAPMTVTTKHIDIEFQYTDISDADLLNLIYRVENLTSGLTQLINDNPAQKLGTGQGVFRNVELTEGLNRISIVLDAGSKPESLPVWINFTEVTTISNLTIDGRAFSHGMIVPSDNRMATGLATMFIEGYAPNATEVIGYSTLRPEGDRSDFLLPNTGQFSFSTGHDSMVELPLRPGDNDLTIIASNPFKSYRADRQFVYNNGAAFLYNTVANAVYGGVKDPAEPWLYKQPTFEGDAAAGPFGISLKTDIKINRNANNGFTHSGFELQVNGLPPIVGNFDLNSFDGNSIDITIPRNAVPTQNYAVEQTAHYYLIKDVVIDYLVFDSETSLQVLNVTFIPVGGLNPDAQSFQFYFVNENLPYVKEVRMADTQQPLYSGIEISILTSSFELEIETENGVNAVNVYLPMDGTGTPVASANVGAGGVANLSLNKDVLPEGQSVLRFVPVSGGQEVMLGAKEYLINYNPSPYVYITNITNGQAYTNKQTDPNLINRDGVVVENSGPVLQIRPVNIPEAQFGDIRVRWNDHYDKIRTDNAGFAANRPVYGDGVTMTGDVARDADGNFVEFRFQFGPNTHANRQPDAGDPSRVNAWTWLEGLNTLIIEVYERGALDANGAPQNGAVPITTAKYELFYFTDALPNVTALDLTNDLKTTGNFQSIGDETFRYYTQESSFRFTASFVEARTVQVRVNTRDQDGNPVQRMAVLDWNGNTFTVNNNHDTNLIAGITAVSGGAIAADNGNATITSMNINLFGSGTNTVEITVTNRAGNFSVRSLEIVREPALFLMHYPAIDQHPVTKAWEGRVNGNYTRVILEAEGADKIIYGKNQEVTRTTPMRIGNLDREVFIFELKGLKRGNNRVSFTVVRGTRSDDVEINLINADTPVPGAEFKESVSKTNIKAFNNQLQLKLARGTVLIRKDRSAADQYLAPTRDLLLAIADPNDGRVNKYLHPAGGEASPFQRKPEWESNFVRIQNINPRFRKVSPLFWIDGGYIPLGDPTQQDILYGSGIYPYEFDKEYYVRNTLNRDSQFELSQPGELTLSYDPNMVQSSWRYVTVFHYGYNENHLGQQLYEWKNIGGVVDPKKNTITVPIQELGYYVVMYMDQSFDDIIGHPWARNYLDTLYSKGIMRNKDAMRFETNEPITRGEFVSLIVKALNMPLNYEGSGTFSDVTRVNPLSFGLYEYKYIETAARAGIARGTLQLRFQPNNPITREDAASLLARAMNLNTTTAEARVNANLEKQFTDATNIGHYAKASVDAVVRKKLMEGKPNVVSSPGDKPTYYFDPKANLTRAEAAVIIMKMMLDQKRIPSL